MASYALFSLGIILLLGALVLQPFFANSVSDDHQLLSKPPSRKLAAHFTVTRRFLLMKRFPKLCSFIRRFPVSVS